MKIQAAENGPIYRVLIVDDDGMIRNLILTILVYEKDICWNRHRAEKRPWRRQARGNLMRLLWMW